MLAHLIQTYGYAAILVGTLLEGETVLVLGGFAARRGHMSLPLVMLVAFAGSLLGDQTMFWVGRIHGTALLKRWPTLERRIAQVRPHLHRFGNMLALLFRFLYGLRNVTPLAMAISGFDPKKFVLLNAIGAAVWAVVVGSLGYLLGEAVEVALPQARHYEMAALVMVLSVAAAVWIARRLWSRRSQT